MLFALFYLWLELCRRKIQRARKAGRHGPRFWLVVVTQHPQDIPSIANTIDHPNIHQFSINFPSISIHPFINPQKNPHIQNYLSSHPIPSIAHEIWWFLLIFDDFFKMIFDDFFMIFDELWWFLLIFHHLNLHFGQAKAKSSWWLQIYHGDRWRCRWTWWTSKWWKWSRFCCGPCLRNPSSCRPGRAGWENGGKMVGKWMEKWRVSLSRSKLLVGEAAPDRLWSPCLTMPGGEFEGFPQQPTRISAAGREDPAFVAQQKSLTSLCPAYDFFYLLSVALLLLLFPHFLPFSTSHKISTIFPHPRRIPQVGRGRQSQNRHPGR